MQAVIDKIMEAKSVAVLTHLNEDPDTIGWVKRRPYM